MQVHGQLKAGKGRLKAGEGRRRPAIDLFWGGNRGKFLKNHHGFSGFVSAPVS